MTKSQTMSRILGQIKSAMVFVILGAVIFAMFATFANFINEHQRLVARLERDDQIISVWRTVVSRNVKMLCHTELEEHHEKICENLPDPDPDKPD